MERKKMCGVLGLAAAMALLGTASVAWASNYAITDLGGLSGVATANSTAAGLNDLGQVTGNAMSTTGYPHAFLYANGSMKDLGTLSGFASYGYGINNSGQVVGQSNHGRPYAITCSASTGMTDIYPANEAVAFGVNSSGVSTGYIRGGYGGVDVCIFSGGSAIDLGNLGGNGQGQAINDHGQVAGFSYTTGNNNVHSFLYSGSGLADIGTLGGSSAWAFGLNNLGYVVGESNPTGSGYSHAFVYTGVGGMVDMGTLGGAWSRAYGINDAGQAVGYAYTLTQKHAFVYAGSTMTDLNTQIDPSLGWSLTEADAINNHGQIAGTGVIHGQTHAFLLTPVSVPEPATLGILGLGVVGMLVRRKRRA